MRQYDPAIARWVVMDPVIHHSMSPYNAFDNNPVFWADPSGADGVPGFIAAMWNATHNGTNTTWTNNGDGSFSTNVGGKGWTLDTETLNFYNEGEQLPELVLNINRSKGSFRKEFAMNFGNHLYSNSRFYESKRSEQRWNQAHEFLDILGVIPSLGEAFDAVNAGLYAYRGDYVMASLSLAAVIPVVGTGATMAKGGRKIWTATSKASNVENAYGHWIKHRNEFPEFVNSSQYVKGPKIFYTILQQQL